MYNASQKQKKKTLMMMCLIFRGKVLCWWTVPGSIGKEGQGRLYKERSKCPAEIQIPLLSPPEYWQKYQKGKLMIEQAQV